MLIMKLRLKFIAIAFIGAFFHQQLSAQLTYGTTGLLNMPSAEMQKDKTVMIGGNYLNKGLTPPWWNYGTLNYFGSFTVFPWLEITATFTLINGESLGYKNEKGFFNQDRYFGFRIRPIKEGQFWKYMPAIVLGTSDPYTEAGDENIASSKVNGYFSRFYIAATKHIQIGNEEIGLHIAYLYNTRKDYPLNGPAFGVSYHPSFHPQLGVIAEYDSKDFAIGATYLLLDHLHMQFEMQKLTRFSGGLAYKIYLK